MTAKEVTYVVGNTYKEIPRRAAKLDRSGKHPKIHDWTLFVDVTAGDPDVIQRVTFDLGSTFSPSTFTCSCPIKIISSTSGTVWRFATRQKSYGFPPVKIMIMGAGGTRSTVKYELTLAHPVNTSPPKKFVERSTIRPMPLLKLDPNQKFGIELELTSPDDIPLERIANFLNSKLSTRYGDIQVIRNYSQGRHLTPSWKMVPDSSIACNISSPNCTTFELVSPVLSGGGGLQQASQVLDTLGKMSPKLQVNKSMGFHVHVDVSNLSVAELVKVCQNFIKYESVMDTFMPQSRRTGSSECQQYFSSNRNAMLENCGGSMKHCFEALEGCDTIQEVANVMNPKGRYHKLNLQNLVTGRQPTVEFRQHSATKNPHKVNAWIRFCIGMVQNSAKYDTPKPFLSKRNDAFRFDALFQYVLKDRALRDIYQKRRQELLLENDHGSSGSGACCNGCAHGGGCTRKRSKLGQ